MVEQTESKVAEAPAITRAGVYGLWLGSHAAQLFSPQSLLWFRSELRRSSLS